MPGKMESSSCICPRLACSIGRSGCTKSWQAIGEGKEDHRNTNWGDIIPCREGKTEDFGRDFFPFCIKGPLRRV